jgi:hypothetical protein
LLQDLNRRRDDVKAAFIPGYHPVDASSECVSNRWRLLEDLRPYDKAHTGALARLGVVPMGQGDSRQWALRGAHQSVHKIEANHRPVDVSRTKYQRPVFGAKTIQETGQSSQLMGRKDHLAAVAHDLGAQRRRLGRLWFGGLSSARRVTNQESNEGEPQPVWAEHGGSLAQGSPADNLGRKRRTRFASARSNTG